MRMVQCSLRPEAVNGFAIIPPSPAQILSTCFPTQSLTPPEDIAMKAYDASSISNVGLFSHGGAGKTSLTEALLFKAKAITRLGQIDDGNTTTDYDPDEIKRQMSVSL